MPKLSRRQFLSSAGGVTLLALSPIGRGLFALAANKNRSRVPVFTALPYIQPGNGTLLREGAESLVVVWQTFYDPAEFSVEFGPDQRYRQAAHVHRAERITGEGAEHRYNYSATLGGLGLGRRVYYRVRCNGLIILEGYATTRRPRGAATRFVSFGDNSCGSTADHEIAYQAYRAHPDFVMNVGDNVYDHGLDTEYSRYFFPVYNCNDAHPKSGAPLLRSVPYYTVLANHDVTDRDADHRSICDLDHRPASLGYYTNMHLPLNGPMPAMPTTIAGSVDRQADFRACAGSRFPRMANYSFDYGDAHYLCLDSNIYIDPTDAALQHWIAADLAATDARWKFVVYHHPAFDVGLGHFDEQHMRVLSPLFERHGVDIVLSGHEHIYQRTRPLRFMPVDESNARRTNSGNRLVPGQFTIDPDFDGQAHTRPSGIIYLVTGAGGNTLYNASFTANPSKWLRPEDKNADYVTRFISDRHSLSVFDLDGHTLTMRQVDGAGNVIDGMRIVKA